VTALLAFSASVLTGGTVAWLFWSSGYATSGSIERGWFALFVTGCSGVLAGLVACLARSHLSVAASVIVACSTAGVAIGGLAGWLYAEHAPRLGEPGPNDGAPIPWFGGVLNSRWAGGAGSIIGAVGGIALAVLVLGLRRGRRRPR
jgi:hypothetical protein